MNFPKLKDLYTKIENHILSSRGGHVVICGYTHYGEVIADEIRRHYEAIKIIYADNYKKNEYVRLTILEAARKFPDAIFCIASYKENTISEFAEQLDKAGIKSNQILYGIPEELQEERIIVQKQIEKKRLSKRACKDFFFEVNIVKHCNLNCERCNHFSPVAPKSFMELAVFERDIRRMAELFTKPFQKILLLGGEPLLHPDVSKFMVVTRKYFPNTKIELMTNGLMVKDMSADFWDTCRKTRTEIVMTQYPINLNYAELAKLIVSNGVKFSMADNVIPQAVPAKDKYFLKCPLDMTGNQDPNENFKNCELANNCSTLENGILYTCSAISNSTNFEAYFSKGVHITENDGIDIYKAQTADEILEFLAHPVSFCRYCNVKGRRNFKHTWKMSERNINEWI